MRQSVNKFDTSQLTQPAECESVADLLCISYEWLGFLASDDLGRSELLRMCNYRVYQQLYNTATYAMPVLQLMGLTASLDNLKELSGSFLRNMTLKQKNKNRKAIV